MNGTLTHPRTTPSGAAGRPAPKRAAVRRRPSPAERVETTAPRIPAQRQPVESHPTFELLRPTPSQVAAGAAPRGARPARPGSLKLTRRGRVVVVLLFLVLALAAFVVFSDTSVATRDAGDPVPTRTVVVSEGDTLWAIAAEVAGEEDLRSVVHEIEELNSLSGPELVEGQELAVPVR